MKTQIRLLFFAPVLLISLIFFSLGCSGKQNNSPDSSKNKSVCDCKLSDVEMVKLFPISCLNDSIVICKRGSINGMAWIDFFKTHKLNDYFSIYNCKTNEYMRGKYGSNSVSYENKALILFSHRGFVAYNSVKNEWIPDLQIDVYKERIYAQAGKIIKSKADFILTPLKYSSKAIEAVNKQFEMKQHQPGSIRVIEYLLGAALSGDALSRDRLINFNKIFPNDQEKSNLPEALEILTNFENYAHEGNEIKFLDLSKYPAFQEPVK